MPESLSPAALMAALANPFDAKEVKYKPQVVQGNRALAMFYTDARVVQDRLDDVMGVEGWQDEYDVLPDNSVVCRLRLKIGGEWVTKMDVGGPSEQPDGGDRMKAAFSDALKRAAVKFGIGRYLYRLPSQWCDYDPAKRQFKITPQLPAFALPRGQKPAAKPAGKGDAAPILPAPDQGDAFEGPEMTGDRLHAAQSRSSPKSIQAIHDLLERLGWHKGPKNKTFLTRLGQSYKANEINALTQAQADEVVTKLRKACDIEATA